MGEPANDTAAPRAVERGHELSDVAIRPVGIFLAALTASLVLTLLVVAGLFKVLETGAQKSDPAPSPLAGIVEPSTAGPLLQVSPRSDMDELRKREEARLNATEWIDAPGGPVRMPIERAMKLAVERGFPEWPAVPLEAAPQQAGESDPSEETQRPAVGEEP